MKDTADTGSLGRGSCRYDKKEDTQVFVGTYHMQISDRDRIVQTGRGKPA